MKKLMVIALAVVLVLTLALGTGVVMAVKPGSVTPGTTDTTYNGNGVPSGPHYTLTIHGAPKDKNPDAEGWTNSNRHSIFVNLESLSKIYMQQGSGFAVVDANGTASGGNDARFQLDEGRYEVFLVALGKPNKEVTITPEATFEGQVTEEVFYLDTITVKHDKKPKWERVTGMFLVTVTVNVGAGDVTYRNAWVFSIPELIEYWWNYDNNGCKLCQVRFYKVDSIPEEGS